MFSDISICSAVDKEIADCRKLRKSIKSENNGFSGSSDFKGKSGVITNSLKSTLSLSESVASAFGSVGKFMLFHPFISLGAALTAVYLGGPLGVLGVAAAGIYGAKKLCDCALKNSDLEPTEKFKNFLAGTLALGLSVLCAKKGLSFAKTSGVQNIINNNNCLKSFVECYKRIPDAWKILSLRAKNIFNTLTSVKDGVVDVVKIITFPLKVLSFPLKFLFRGFDRVVQVFTHKIGK